MYGAGAVGSMSRDKAQKEEKVEISEGLYQIISDSYRSIGVKYEFELKSERYEIEMREQSFRISSNLIIRPWIFNYLVGDSPKFISSLRIGNILIVGTPCDFSGELVDPIEKSITNKK